MYWFRVFIVRYAIVLAACVLADQLLLAAQPCLAGVSGLTDLIWCPLLMRVHLELKGPTLELNHYLPLLTLAVVIVALWSVFGYVWRRRSQGASGSG
jgi:hypothetical protein